MKKVSVLRRWGKGVYLIVGLIFITWVSFQDAPIMDPIVSELYEER